MDSHPLPIDTGDSSTTTKSGNLSISEDEARPNGTTTANHTSQSMDSPISGKDEDACQATDDNSLVSALQSPHRSCERPAMRDTEKPDPLRATQQSGLQELQAEVNVSCEQIW